MRGRRVDFPLMLVAVLVAIPQSCASPSHRAQMAPQFRPVFMRLSLTWCTILRALVHDRSELPNPGLKIPGPWRISERPITVAEMARLRGGKSRERRPTARPCSRSGVSGTGGGPTKLDRKELSHLGRLLAVDRSQAGMH